MTHIYVVLVDNPRFAQYDKIYIQNLINKGHYYLNLQTAQSEAETWSKLLGYPYKVVQCIQKI